MISDFSKKQVDTYLVVYLFYRYLNWAQTAGLVSGKTFPLVIPLEGFPKLISCFLAFISSGDLSGQESLQYGSS